MDEEAREVGGLDSSTRVFKRCGKHPDEAPRVAHIAGVNFCEHCVRDFMINGSVQVLEEELPAPESDEAQPASGLQPQAQGE